MEVFNIFLVSFAAILSLISIGLVYHISSNSRESEFVPIYYFIGMGIAGVFVVSVSRFFHMAGFEWSISSSLIQDLFISYIALFLFGSLWQSYEAEMCRIEFLEDD